MTTKKCNWKTDLQLAETFYTYSDRNTLVASPIPDEAIDFQIVYRAEHDRRYTISRTGGVYKGCKKIDENTLAVFIPLSRYPLGRGPLLRELYMRVPNNDFEGNIRNICVPADTKHLLWDGPTDNDVVVASDIITAIILKGNPGDSAYEIYRRLHQESELTEAQYAALPVEVAAAASAAGAEATEAVRRAKAMESDLRSAEQQRTDAETFRAEAEAARSEQEQSRIANEQARGTAFREAIDETHAAAQAAIGAAADLEAPQEVLAHSGCTLDERIAAVERLLLDVLSGKTLVPELQVKKLGVWGGSNLVLTGDGAPAKAPDRAGQFYIDTTARALYFSTGNAAVSDWINA